MQPVRHLVAGYGRLFIDIVIRPQRVGGGGGGRRGADLGLGSGGRGKIVACI